MPIWKYGVANYSIDELRKFAARLGNNLAVDSFLDRLVAEQIKAGTVDGVGDGEAGAQGNPVTVAEVDGYTSGSQHPVRLALPPHGTGVQNAPGGSSYPYRRNGA